MSYIPPATQQRLQSLATIPAEDLSAVCSSVLTAWLQGKMQGLPLENFAGTFLLLTVLREAQA